jgi:hypothetical protein
VTTISQAPAAVGIRQGVRTLTLGAVFAAMFVLGLAFSLRLLNPWESWFLQVVARMRAGDVLYRDISYGAGPLPAYLTEGVTYVVGVDIAAVKLVVVVAFAATATMAWLIAEQLEIGLGGRLLVLGGLAYFAPPLQQPPYAPLATTFLLAALLAALVSRHAETARERAIAGLGGGGACALAFGSKQNVGLYALAAFVFVCAIERHLRTALWAAGSFVAVACCLLVPVWLTGGFAGYVDYGFTGKEAYIHAPNVFVAALRGVVQAVGDIRSLAGADAAFWAVGFFLPALAVGGLVALVYAGWSRRRPDALPIVAFAAAGSATLYPRLDPTHVAFAAPALVLLLAYALHIWRSRVHRFVWMAIAAWVGIAFLLIATLPLRLARSPDANLSPLPHLRGAFVQRDDVSLWRREAARLVSAAQGDSDGLFLLVPDAGFRYLMTGLKNPTAFDFPFVTTFGRDGEQRVVDALASGRILRVCLADDWSGLEPKVLVRYVRGVMRRGAQLGPCTMYAARASHTA